MTNTGIVDVQSNVQRLGYILRPDGVLRIPL